MSKQKKIAFGIIGVFIIAALSAGAWFYKQNLSGSGPAFRSPDTDITNVIPPSGSPAPATNTTGMPLHLPDGFGISIYAKGLGSPRALGLDPHGRLITSIPSQGKLVAFDDNNGIAGSPIPVVTGLNKPHGFAFRCDQTTCKLFVAEVNSVKVFTYDTAKAVATAPQKILDLPNGGNHTSRTLHILNTANGPRLLVAIGSSCNVCNEQDERRAAIWSSNLDGSDFKPYATGLRNSVFMAENPQTGELWATDMGRDLLGDNTPPDEVNIITEGKSYGWPICYSKNIHDTDFDKNQYIRDPCTDKQAPRIELQAHSAPLGLAFIPANDDHYNAAWPEEFRGDLLVAYHGSWNRSVPTGYKIVRYELNAAGKVTGTSDFLTGFLASDNKTALGRPVDILANPGQGLFVSDDKAGVIYKIAHP